VSEAAHLLGAILAGGESRRYGRDKAREPVGGISLLSRAFGTLAEVFTEVVVVSGHRPAESDGWTLVPDLRPGRGPVGGIEAALREADARGLDGAFVLACDLPLITSDAVRAVLSALGEAAAAAPDREGFPGVEPLCAAYRTTCLPTVEGMLDRDERAAHRIFDAVRAVTVGLDPALFLNVNTSSDRDDAESALGRPPS